MNSKRFIGLLVATLAMLLSSCSVEDDNSEPKAPAPDLLSVFPQVGQVAGGTHVSLTGVNFQSGATVTFDSLAATNVVVVSQGSITCDTPAHAAGAVAVVVSNSDGQSDVGGFTYTAVPGPDIVSVAPTSGSIAGGTAVTVTGMDFQSGATVSFGGASATGVTFVNATTITCSTPAHALGVADVLVQNPDFQTDMLASGFSYDLSWAVTSNPSTSSDMAYAIAVNSSALYVAGYDFSTGDYRWRIEKRSLSDGSLLSGFGTGGAVVTYPIAGTSRARAIILDASYLYAAGFDSYPGNSQFRIEKRILGDGTSAAGFGTGGAVVSNPSTGADYATAIAINSSYLYVAGVDSTASNLGWRIEKRSLSNGSLDPSFGAGGWVQSNPSTNAEYPYAIAVGSSGLYVVGDDLSLGSVNRQWRIEKRNLGNGSLVSSFGAGGVVLSNLGSPGAYAVALDSSALYVAGSDSSLGGGDGQWRIEKRSLSDGSLVSGFGTGGVIVSNPSSRSEGATSIALDSTYLYIAGGDWSPGVSDTQWRVEKRTLSDGSLVSGFGTGGVVVSNPSTRGDGPTAIALDSSYLYAAGSDSYPGASDIQWRVEKMPK